MIQNECFLDVTASLYTDGALLGEIEEQPPTLEADVVYLLMRRNIPLSRTTRVKWLIDRINTTITLPVEENYDVWVFIL